MSKIMRRDIKIPNDKIKRWIRAWTESYGLADLADF